MITPTSAAIPPDPGDSENPNPEDNSLTSPIKTNPTKQEEGAASSPKTTEDSPSDANPNKVLLSSIYPGTILGLIRTSRQSVGTGALTPGDRDLLATSMCLAGVPCHEVMALVGPTEPALPIRMKAALHAPDLTHLECIARMWSAMLDQPDEDRMAFAYTEISQEFDTRMEQYLPEAKPNLAKIDGLLSRLGSQLKLAAPLAYRNHRRIRHEFCRRVALLRRFRAAKALPRPPHQH